MVGTRASARLRAVTKEELNSPVAMQEQEHEQEAEVEEQEPHEKHEKQQEGEACRRCEELKKTPVPAGAEDPDKPPSQMSGYLVGFGKRVVICTILVFAFKNVWPQVQNHFWPEAPVKEGKCYVLNDKSFKGHVSRGDHLVMMYAPWCGHCQKLKPIWDKIAKQPGVAGVKVSKVDCTASTAVCGEYGVKGYPTILYFRNGKKLETYNGAKSEPELKEYIARMKGGEGSPSLEDLMKDMPPPPPVKNPAKTKKNKKVKMEL